MLLDPESNQFRPAVAQMPRRVQTIRCSERPDAA